MSAVMAVRAADPTPVQMVDAGRQLMLKGLWLLVRRGEWSLVEQEIGATRSAMDQLRRLGDGE